MDLDQHVIGPGLGLWHIFESQTCFAGMLDQCPHRWRSKADAGGAALDGLPEQVTAFTLVRAPESEARDALWHHSAVFVSHAGMLLVATPRLLDPYFFRTVVLLIQHDPEGTVGLVLNRETSAEVVDHLPGWAALAIAPGRIHYGGPVEPEVAIGLSLTSTGLATGVAGLSLVDLADDPPFKGTGVRVYSGYSGWGTGQLEDEVSSGSWFLVPAAPDDPFADPEYQWRDVLRRQSGLLSVVSTYPDDPSLN